jgi:hypothetical protein
MKPPRSSESIHRRSPDPIPCSNRLSDERKRASLVSRISTVLQRVAVASAPGGLCPYNVPSCTREMDPRYPLLSARFPIDLVSVPFTRDFATAAAREAITCGLSRRIVSRTRACRAMQLPQEEGALGSARLTPFPPLPCNA